MAILSVVSNPPGLVDVLPGIIYINTNDSLSTVLTAGYLNPYVPLYGNVFNENEIALVNTTNDVVFLNINISNGVISLELANSGDVVLPTIVNHIATYTNVTGTIGEDAATAINGGNIQAGLSGTAGTLASFPGTAAKGSLNIVAVANTGNTITTISNAAMGQASVISIPDPGVATSNFIIADSAGTQHITTGSLSVDVGNIAAGSSGHAGTVSSFPTTASRGSLILAAVANTGATNTTISNAAMGQASVISIPDPAGATADFVIAPAALVSGNLIKASGTAGLVADAAFFIKANVTASYAGGGTSNAFTATGLTATSIVTAVIATSTNAVSIVKAVPTSNVLTVTFSADPGAATTVYYIATSAAV